MQSGIQEVDLTEFGFDKSVPFRPFLNVLAFLAYLP